MLMVLGDFVFEQQSLLPNQRSRTREQQISDHGRIGQRDVLQHLGPGRDEWVLSGSVFPLQWGSDESLNELAVLADQGGAHRLIDNQGVIHGLWMIAGLTEEQTHFNPNGRAQQIDFTVTLRRTAQ